MKTKNRTSQPTEPAIVVEPVLAAVNFKKVLEITFIPSWNTHAYICEGGDIWVQLLQGRSFNRHMFLNSEAFIGFNEKFKAERLSLFDKLDEYYRQTYCR